MLSSACDQSAYRFFCTVYPWLLACPLTVSYGYDVWRNKSVMVHSCNGRQWLFSIASAPCIIPGKSFIDICYKRIIVFKHKLLKTSADALQGVFSQGLLSVKYGLPEIGQIKTLPYRFPWLCTGNFTFFAMRCHWPDNRLPVTSENGIPPFPCSWSPIVSCNQLF